MKRHNKTKRSVYEKFLTDHYLGYVDRAANEHIDARVKKGIKERTANAPDPVISFLNGFAVAAILGAALLIFLYW